MEHVKGPDMQSEDEFVRLVAAYQQDLLKICYVYLRDAALAEDAVQETFLKAYRKMDSFRGESSEKTWLMRIAINTCKDMHRNAWFRFLDRRLTPEELPQQSAMAPEDGELMADILRLPPKWKEVILLYYFENMSEHEIAASLGVGVSTVSTRLAKARRKLRMVMEGDEGHER